ncbi:hypothetical protein C0995_012407 [Termitomyces sp. Mi166|nr:hypothetical protein C0995_012407 [Termitomyces sp. Mi166\
MYSALPQAFGTSYYVISLSVNIVITILITIRLLLYRRRMLNTLPDAVEQASDYVSLATIMIESAALYSVLSLIFIITYAIGNPLNQTFLTAASCGQQIAGFLIIYRVAQGRAWDQDTVTKHSRSFGSLAFASSKARQTNSSETDTLEQEASDV